jgi:hypothetical protein
MRKYLLGVSIDTILLLTSGIGLPVSAQPVNAAGQAVNQNTYPCHPSTVCITSVQIEPERPLVGSAVKVYANVTNNEKESISFMSSLREPAISLTFDNHVRTLFLPIMCPLFIVKGTINPGETVTLSGNPCGEQHRVVSGGTVTDNATFTYSGGTVEKAFSFSTAP